MPNSKAEVFVYKEKETYFTAVLELDLTYVTSILMADTELLTMNSTDHVLHSTVVFDKIDENFCKHDINSNSGNVWCEKWNKLISLVPL